MLAAVPGALIQRLFLAPDKIMYVRILLEFFLYRFVRERIKLFDTDDSHVGLLVFAAFFQQVVINLAGTEHHALNAFWIDIVNFADGWLEAAVSQLFQRRDSQRMTQQKN